MNDRTKIAADLRRAADYPRDWMCRLDPRLGVLHNTLYEMMRVTGCFENHKSANPPMLFHRLADIIDPTCHNKQIEINKMAPLEFRTDNLICSNCGETFCADPDGINAPIDWAYCPNCGYRIVETNSGEDNNSER